MKKAFRKIYSLLLSTATLAVCAVSAFGCSKEENSSQTQQQEETAGTFVINDFSSNKELYQLIPKNMFGKISLNTDEDYVWTGGGSAKLEPDMSATAEPYFKQRLTSTDFNYHHGDIRKATKITAQVYNAADTVITMQTELEFSDSQKSARETVTLNPGEWNTVNYKIYSELLGLRFNVQEAMYINYYVQRKTVAQQPVLYMDNISISYVDEAPQPIEISLKEDEFCSFDQNYQAFLPYLKGWGNYLEEVKEMTLSANPKFTVGGEGCSYKIRTLAGSDTRQSYWLYFPETLCQAAKLNQVKAGDKLTFSVYNDSDVDTKLFVQVRFKVKIDGVETVRWAPTRYDPVNLVSNLYPKGWYYDDYMLKANEWTDITVDFGTMEEQTLKCFREEESFQDDKLEDYDVLGNLTDVVFGWGAFNNCAEKTFYVDDMKIVKGA